MPGNPPVLGNDEGPRETWRQCIERYLLEHPEYDLPQTTGELIFWIGRQPGTGRPSVAAVFHAMPRTS
jgi:hypothetical protein